MYNERRTTLPKNQNGGKNNERKNIKTGLRTHYPPAAENAEKADHRRRDRNGGDNKKPSDKGYRKILRNDRHGSILRLRIMRPRRRFIRRLELQGQTRQKVDGNKGRQHKRISVFRVANNAVTSRKRNLQPRSSPTQTLTTCRKL